MARRKPSRTHRRSELAPARAPIWPAIIAIAAGCALFAGATALLNAL